MALGEMSNNGLDGCDSANWARKMGELIQRENKVELQAEILKLIQFGQLTGVLRTDLEPSLLAGIFLEVSTLYQDCRVCPGRTQGDCPGVLPSYKIGNIVGILLNGFNREGDAREGN